MTVINGNAYGDGLLNRIIEMLSVLELERTIGSNFKAIVTHRKDMGVACIFITHGYFT